MRVKTMVWGIGNAIYGDDRAGVEVSERLKKNPPDNTSIYTCYTVPGNYIIKIKKDSPQRLIIVDASDMGLSPGEIRQFSLSRIADVSFTNHDMPLSMMLLPFKSLEVTVIGIQPERVTLTEQITEKTLKAVETVTQLIQSDRIDEIESL